MSKNVFVLGLILLVLLAIPAGSSIAQDESIVINIGTLDLPVQLDTATADSFDEWEILSHIYTGLTQQIPGTTSYELAVATAHEVSEDGLQHTFTIRDDATFTDGTPLTAETFQRSIERVLTLDAGGASILRDVVDEVSARDETTLEFVLTQPVPYMDGLVALPPFFAIHPDDMARADDNTTTVIGNGRYTIADFVPGESVRLMANADYQFGAAASNDVVHLTHYLDTETLRLALADGDIDIAWRDVRLADATTTAEDNDMINISVIPSTRMWYVVINLNEQFVPPNDDALMREVILKSINRPQIVEVAFNNVLDTAESLVPALVGDAYNPIFVGYDEPRQGLTVFEANDYSPSRPVNFSFISSRQAYGDYYANGLNRLRASLSAINRYVIVTSNAGVPAGEWPTRLQEGAYQGAMFAYTPVVAHPDAYLRTLLHSGSPLAASNQYGVTEVDVLLNQARRTPDRVEQDALYREAQTLMLDQYAIMPLWQGVVHVLYRDGVEGVTLNANYFMHYDLIEK